MTDYKNNEIKALCSKSHKNYYIIDNLDLNYIRKKYYTLIGLNELSDTATNHPVFISVMPHPALITLTSISTQPKPSFTPLQYQLYPFTLEVLDNEHRGILLFDANSHRLTTDSSAPNSYPLFDDRGQAAPALIKIGQLAKMHHEEIGKAEAFCQALIDYNLLSESSVSITSAHDKLYIINEDVFADLNADQLQNLQQKKHLQIIGFMLLSQQYWARRLKDHSQNNMRA